MSNPSGVLMAKKKVEERGRYELKAPQSLLDEAEQTANSIGMSLAAYIRMLLIEDMQKRKQQQSKPAQ